MIAKIKSTGGGHHKGVVAVPIEFFLEESDPRYEEHVVPDVERYLDEYTGKLDENGWPVESEEFEKWKASIPTRVNPAHTHFFPADPSISDEEILKTVQEFLPEVLKRWTNKESMNISNKNLQVEYPATVTSTRKAECDSRMATIRQSFKASPIRRSRPLSRRNAK